MSRFLILAIAILTFSGCAATATDPHNYTLLAPGQSTIEDATRLLGSPIAYSLLPSGKTLLQWVDYPYWPTLHVVIAFDADGRMIEVRQIVI